jgi:predicted dehydrogenase
MITRRQFAAASAFTIVPRHVVARSGQPAPSDRITLAAIGMGRQGMAVTMDLLARPDVQVIAVCDCNQGSKDYAEYSANALLTSARRLLGPGHENWGEDLASPGSVMLTHTFRTSLGMGGRDPAKRMVEAYYAARKGTPAYKGCTAYRDYRELLEKESGLDAVYIATPDHWHAPITIAALRRRKHVLCQKPMTHNVGEARRVAELARQMGVATSVTVNNPTSDATKTISTWLAAGAVGAVREVHNWSSRPYWPQGVDRPTGAMAVPANLDWDLWLGPAPERPYHKAYLPFVWRGWHDFGCGSFGDMGCYSFAGLFKILDLTPPLAVEASASETHEETYPLASIVNLEFPANGGRAPLRLSWYDGGLMPPRPAGIDAAGERLFRRGGEGVLYVGDKGILLGGFNGQSPKVYPEKKEFSAAPRERPAGGGGAQGPPPDAAIDQWLAACKNRTPGGPSSIPAQAPATEAFLLGCLAQRLPNERFQWDTAAMKVTNSEAANKFIDPPYRGNWT